ncbi:MULTISPECIES: hypothetical protein [unclassified Endozoicomonas]|uniref:hypothetical protein n=1 Tax=unclassified Endozoicomonas TaxID=2644528 RepID=UPI003BB5D5C0
MASEIGRSALELTAADFKALFIGFIQDRNQTPELLRQEFASFPEDKRALLEEYRVDSLTEAMSENPQEWLRPGYFDKQAQMAKQNFCQKRIEHLIKVKSHLIEQGIAGFTLSEASASQPQHSLSPSQDHSMSGEFTTINLNGFQPSRPLANSVNDGDLSKIRMALFMEMNDKTLGNTYIRQAIAWALKQKPNLFVSYEENAYAQAINPDMTQWSADYYGLQEVYASSNFSEKRLSHMLAVRERVFSIKEHPVSTSQTPVQQSSQTRPNRPEQSSQNTNRSEREKPESVDSGKNSILPILVIAGVLAVVAAVLLATIIG